MPPLPQRRPVTQIAILLLCWSPLVCGAASGARARKAFPPLAPPDRASAGRPAPQEAGPLPVFEFHSGFWVNLHHFLYKLAREQKGSSRPATSPDVVKFTEKEKRAWQAAVDYYAAKYADLDLVVNSDLIILKDQLADVENCEGISGRSGPRCDASLPKDITRILESAAPVYRAHWWSEHDRANRRWTAQVAPMVRQWGKDLAAELARIYQVKWPAGRIRVDVTAYADSAGAYTTLDPLRVTIASLDPRNQGPAAFEMLFHEASHSLAEPVQTAIVRECRARGKPIPRDLWHAIVFYTTGEAVKNVLSQANENGGGTGQSYTPYAVREGLYTRGWSNYLRVIEQFWQPYLEGRMDFSDAIARMVSSL
jgi:hypothetical protein